jgi:cell wall-associated NlpC family hydrolase
MAAYLPYLYKGKMYTRLLPILLVAGALFSGCRSTESEETVEYISLAPVNASLVTDTKQTVVGTTKQPVAGTIETGITRPEAIVEYAKTLQGVPYLYASTDPAKGFDCSGFISYVFNHFAIKVPRSSVDFTNEGKEVPESAARPGDLILFTGTDSASGYVGHMGIVINNTAGKFEFIHSSSGKARGVVITPLETYYRSRFIKVIRVFPDSFFI